MKVIARMIKYFFIGLCYLINQFLTSKKVLAILIVALFMSLIDVSSSFKEVLQKQDEQMISEGNKPDITFYQENADLASDDGTGMNDLIRCYQEGINIEESNSDIQEYIKKLDNLYKESNKYFSFLYQDLYSGFTVSYNEDAPIFTASTIKAPAMIYLYEGASRGEVNLDEVLTYTSKYYSGGTGVLQNRSVNTNYSIEELVGYTIHNSDNIAYRMLMDRFSRKEMYEFWKGKGTKYIFSDDTIWGFVSAKDASIYMRELYRFYNDDKEYGTRLMEHFKNASWKLVTDKSGRLNTANKGGWSGIAIHDVAIVFDKNPYILVVMSNLGEEDYSYLFQNTNKLVGSLHEAYWKYKEQICSGIKQY